MYQYHHGMLPNDIYKNFFTTNDEIHAHDTRHSRDIHIQPSTTILAGNTLKSQGAVLWNNLDSSIKSSPSNAVFKSKIKNLLIGNYDISPTY
jgi:hypothetical protein